MQVIKNMYFKLTYAEGQVGERLISGLPLPDPAKGPYTFINCEVHPRLWCVFRQDRRYFGSVFENTYVGLDRYTTE